MENYLIRCYFLFHALTGFSQVMNTDSILAKISIHPEPFTKELTGEVTYFFKMDSVTDSLELNAVNMKISQVRIDQKEIGWKYDNKLLQIKLPKSDRQFQLKINYTARPSQSLYFIGWDNPRSGAAQIWTQGQGKYSSHWVPSFDDMAKKVVFNLSIISSPDYSVIANGKLEKITQKDSLRQWNYNMNKPMSSYLLGFVVGKFDSIIQYARTGIPIISYYPKGREELAINAYQKNVEIFDFLESEIGVAYPWQNYKQVPVHDFMYAGMENTGLTTFDDTYLVDSIGHQDRNYLPINAHELAHQWFGNLVTETDGAQHWLHEGFASFYGALAEEHILGQDHLSWKLYKTAIQLLALDHEMEGTSLLDPKSGSLVFYEKGAWALFALRAQLGTEVFRKGIQEYVKTYSFRNATVENFLEVMQNYAGVSLVEFRATWLESNTFPWKGAREILKKRSAAIGYLIDLKEILNNTPDPLTELQIREAWERHDDQEYKAALIRDFIGDFSREIILDAMNSEAPVIQHEILLGLKTSESWALPFLEKYLDANSYEVRYQAFVRLWINVPQKRATWMQRMLENGSLENLRIRQLWYTLSLLMNGFLTPELYEDHLNFLIDTTDSSYNWEIRMHAFQLISQIGAFENRSLKNLIQGTEHHAWQFKLFCRRLLDEMIKENFDIDYWQMFLKEFPKGSFPYFYAKISEL